MNAVEIEEAVSRLAEAPFDGSEFPFAFLEAFGNNATTLKRLRSEQNSSNQSDVGGVLQLAGITTVKQIRENAFDIKATGRLNRLYVELLKDNPDWDQGDRREDFNHFMARLIFCFFAEDTNIFHGDGLFTQTIARMSDGENTHEVLAELFRAMATPLEEREALGMHYTSVPNILKVLNPLFLDDLRNKLEDAGDNGRKLLNLRQRMAKIRVFDPACGSGNFLVIAYKEMRSLEAEINRRRGEGDRGSEIPLTNFRGIEIRHFAVEVARLALIIAEYQCDVLYRGQMLALAEFLPLKSDNWITCGNALRLDWLSLCPPTGKGVTVQREDLDLWQETRDEAEIDFKNEGGETYICGNPPYVGDKFQTQEQKQVN